MMRSLRKVAVAVVAGLLSLVLSGCAGLLPKPVFSDSASAETFLLQTLQSKYGMAFDVVGPAKDPGSDPLWFSATVAPVDDPAKTAQAAVKSAGGGVRDDYAQYLYKDQIEGMSKAVCAPLAYLDSCDVAISMSMTLTKWDLSTPLDVFVKTSGVRNMVKATLKPADSIDTYVNRLLDLQNALVAGGAYFEVNAYVGSCLAWTKDYDAVRTRLQTYADILEVIQPKLGAGGSC